MKQLSLFKKHTAYTAAAALLFSAGAYTQWLKAGVDKWLELWIG